MDDSHPSLRSAQLIWQRNKYVLKKKKPLKSELKRREYITDVRRTYAQMFLNAVNSFDVDILENMFKEHCTPDLVSLSFYDGEENPWGAKTVETKSTAAHLAYWSSLFKSAPDFVFETSFLTAYIDPVTNIRLVRCRFTMTGTRILDIKVAQKVQADATRKRSKNKDKFPTVEGDLMVQIHEQLAASYPLRSAGEGWEWDLLNDNLYLDESLFLPSTSVPGEPGVPDVSMSLLEVPQPDSVEGSVSGSSTAPSKRKRAGAKGKESPDETAEIVEKMSSMFTPGEAVELTSDLSRTMHVDDKPLDESLKLEYRGTFTVYLDDDNKICRYEFVHTTGQEARAREAAAAVEAQTEAAKLAAKLAAEAAVTGTGITPASAPRALDEDPDSAEETN